MAGYLGLLREDGGHAGCLLLAGLTAFGILAAGARRSRLRRSPLRLVGLAGSILVWLGGGRSIGKSIEILLQLGNHALEVGHLDQRVVAYLLLVT